MLEALKKALKSEFDAQAVNHFRSACQGDEALWKRVQPLAGLVRFDTFGYPVVIPSGSVFVTQGTDRRSSGTHYTPRSLTEPIVQYTLEPLVYDGPAEGKPKEEWKLHSAKELLDLKICDMACGSGAFLVQACRYLADWLMEAWDDCERQEQTGQHDLQGGVAGPGHQDREDLHRHGPPGVTWTDGTVPGRRGQRVRLAGGSRIRGRVEYQRAGAPRHTPLLRYPRPWDHAEHLRPAGRGRAPGPPGLPGG